MARPYKGFRIREGFRIVKPRTERQREHALDYGHRPESVMVIHKADAGLPRDSWWIRPRTWQGFAGLARKQQKRMALSRFGRTIGDNAL